MNNKKKLWFRRVLCIVIVAGMLAKYVMTGDCVYAFEGKENKQIEEPNYSISDTYIVSAANDDICEEIKQDYFVLEKSESNNKSYIPKDNYAVVALNSEEAHLIQKEYGNEVTIEKNVIVSASKKEKKVKKKIKKFNLSKDYDWNKKIVKADLDDKIVEDVSDNKKVKVAIIDSGINFDERITVTKSINFVPKEEEVSPVFLDVSGHGTSVASIIAADDEETGLVGINKNVEIYSARVLSDNGTAPVSRVIEAIYWAIDNKVDIINMSFGTVEYSEALKNAVSDAYDAGILIIAAAGNSKEIEYPAAYNEVIAVGSVNSGGEISEFSATGEEVELVAPGEQVLTVGNFGEYEVLSGTSLAAPHVTAIASLIKEHYPNSDNKIIREVLNQSANEISDNYKIVDYEYALKIYDKVKADYESSENNNVIDVFDNNSEIEVYTNNGLVEGSWKTTDHVSFVPSDDSLSKKIMTCLKAGAKAPDIIEKYAKLSNYPELHGGGRRRTSYNDTNYVACYASVILMADWLCDNANNISYDKLFNYIKSTKIGYELQYYYNMNHDYRSSIECISKIVWNMWMTDINNHLSNQYGFTYGSITNKQKKAFLYGVAMHILADSYAHSTYAVVDGRWTQLKHNKESSIDPDNVNVGRNRYDIAKEAIINTFLRYKGTKKGELTADFYANDKHNLYMENEMNNKSFKMWNLWYYSWSCNKEITGNMYRAFTNVNVNDPNKWK